MIRQLVPATIVAAMPRAGWAADPSVAGQGGPGLTAIILFFAVVLVTLGITAWAARRTRSAQAFYSAGGQITGFQNGLAIAGDFLSAATFLGITSLTYAVGLDAAIYVLSPLVGLGIVLFLIAERLRNLGRYTFADVIGLRFSARSLRAFTAMSGLTVVVLYLIAQIVGAGALIQVLFSIPYPLAVVIVGVLMMIYVGFGGMLATTWVQLSKAVLLLFGLTLLAILVLFETGFSLPALYRDAADLHRLGAELFAPGHLVKDPYAALSLGFGLTFGLVGLPHVLMRFFTVPNANEARRSAVFSTFFIAYVFVLIIFVIGFGTIAFVSGNPAYLDAEGEIIGGANMVAIHLAHRVGGDLLLGFMAAVAFATILAVVAGLTLAGASAISHDLYAQAIRQGKADEKTEMRLSRIAVVIIGALAITLGIAFEGQNIAYIISLALGVAASANFPVLVLSLYWRGMTTRGAVIGGSAGLLTSVLLVLFGPTVWVEILGNDAAVFDIEYPALIAILVAFGGIWAASRLDPARHDAQAQADFDAQLVRSVLGPRS